VKYALNHRTQRAVAVSAAALAVLGATGCSAINDQATATEYSASDGIVERVGPVLLRNVLIIASDKSEPGTLLGTLFNESGSTVRVTIEGENESSEITIPADGKYVFEDEVADGGTLEGISEIPGALVDIDFTVNSETETLRVPVLDGTLEEYREYVPGGFTEEPAPAEEKAEEEGH
jgi:hypothetical protein